MGRTARCTIVHRSNIGSTVRNGHNCLSYLFLIIPLLHGRGSTLGTNSVTRIFVSCKMAYVEEMDIEVIVYCWKIYVSVKCEEKRQSRQAQVQKAGNNLIMSDIDRTFKKLEDYSMYFTHPTSAALAEPRSPTCISHNDNTTFATPYILTQLQPSQLHFRTHSCNWKMLQFLFLGKWLRRENVNTPLSYLNLHTTFLNFLEWFNVHRHYREVWYYSPSIFEKAS